MSKTQQTRKGWEVLSVIPLALVAVIGVAMPAHAQSSGAPDTMAPATARKEATPQRAAASATPGPFTYDAVGATPKVRMPKKPGMSSPKVNTRASSNPSLSEKPSQHDAVKVPASASSR